MLREHLGENWLHHCSSHEESNLIQAIKPNRPTLGAAVAKLPVVIICTVIAVKDVEYHLTNVDRSLLFFFPSGMID